MADLPGEQAFLGERVLEALRQASQGLLFPSETDAPIEPFFWSDAAPMTPSIELVASRANVEIDAFEGKTQEAKPFKTQSLAAFFKPTVVEEDWHNEQEKAEVKRFQVLLAAVKSNLKTPKVFRVGKVEIEVYVVGQVSDGYAGFKTMVVET